MNIIKNNNNFPLNIYYLMNNFYIIEKIIIILYFLNFLKTKISLFNVKIIK